MPECIASQAASLMGHDAACFSLVSSYLLNYGHGRQLIVPPPKPSTYSAEENPAAVWVLQGNDAAVSLHIQVP